MKIKNNRITQLERQIKSLKRALEKAEKAEKAAVTKWRTNYSGKFGKSLEQLDKTFKPRTKKEARLWKQIMDFRKGVNVSATAARNEHRRHIAELREQIAKVSSDIVVLKEQEFSEVRQIDEIVRQTLSLNDALVRASTDRGEFLKRHLFPRMIDEKGNLRTQISFDSSDGLSRVVVRVNHLTRIDPDLATRAQALIDKFFESFQDPVKLSPTVKILYDLTQELLVKRVAFKVGPSFYRFIAVNIDPSDSAELAEAQNLLRQSVRFEKTNSYIKIYRRESRSSPWVEIAQS